MIDIMRAIAGQRHCGWCRDRPQGLWDKAYNKAGKVIPRLLKWWMFKAPRLNIWRIGAWWHYRYHLQGLS